MTGIGTGHNDALIDWTCPVNPLASLNRDLVGWWMAVPGSIGGRTLVDLRRGRNLTLTNIDPVAGWNTRVADVIPGTRYGNQNAVYFNNSTSVAALGARLETPDAFALDLTPDLTIAAWICPFASGSSLFRSIAAKRITASTTTNYQIYLNNAAGANAGALGYYNGVAVFDSSTIPPVLSWSHVAATAKGTALTLYYNGNSVHTATLSVVPAVNTSAFYVGWSGWASGGSDRELFYGYIDDVRLQKRCLSPAEMRQLYHASRTGYQAELRRIPRSVAWSVPAAGGSSMLLLNPPNKRGNRRASMMAGMQ